MRASGPFSQYNRYVIRYGFNRKYPSSDAELIAEPSLGAGSLLAGFAAMEARLLREFVIWAGCETKDKPLEPSQMQLEAVMSPRPVYRHKGYGSRL